MGSSRRKNGSSEPSRKPGCPVPLPGGCLRGMPLPESFEEGVKMKCSNAVCEYQEQFIHLECFHALEENLIKIMSNIGSARGWTDTQRRSNLWDKKGLTLIQKKCRCPCGLGLMSLDENAMFLARQSAAGTTGPQVKAKKGKTKNLPKLNFSSGPTVGASCEKHVSRRENKKRYNFRSESINSTRSATSTLTTEYSYEARRSNRVFSGAKTGGSPVWKDECEFVRRPSEAHFPALVDEKSDALAPTVVNSKKENSLSYAAATSSKLTDEGAKEKKAQKSRCVTSTPLSSRSGERKRDQVSESGDFTVDSSCNSVSFAEDNHHENHYTRDLVSPESQQDCDVYGGSPPCLFYPCHRKYDSDNGQYADSGLEVDVSVIMPSPPLSSPSEREYELTQRNASVCDSAEDADNLGTYDLFNGPSFYLGELLLADIHLPGAF